jgi:Ala-tRNA(Pro) deacylase
MAVATDTYGRLIALLDLAGARYREIDHPPEGRTEIVSAMRGHPVGHAAKCVVLLVKLDRRSSAYVLAVVPGDARVDFAAIRHLKNATYVGFADTAVAERMAGSVSGTILPFSFDSALELLVDPDVLKQPEIFFNAARLDRSLALSTEDYRRLAQPRLAPIAVR